MQRNIREDKDEFTFATWCKDEGGDIECQLCRTIYFESKSPAPNHEPSRYCESGKRPHCTCDTCF